MTSPAAPDERGRLRALLRNGTVLALLLLAVSTAQAFAGLAGIVDLTFPLLAVGLTVSLLTRNLVAESVELSLWLWATAPGLRRVVDWLAGTHNSESLILVTPSLTSLLVGALALRPRARYPTAFLYAWGAVVGAGLWGALVGLRAAGLIPAAVSAVLWFAPLMLGAAIVSDPVRNTAYVDAIQRFTRWALLLLSVYAIVQWAVAPAWDVAWLRVTTPTTNEFGLPEPFEIRAWGLSNAPFVFAHLLVWLLLSQVGRRKNVLARIGIAAGVIALGLTAVHAAWLTALIAVFILQATRRMKVTPLLLTGACVVFGVVTFAPQVATEVETRLSTVGTLSSDVSLLSRLDIYGDALPVVLSDVIGGGMGSTGSGSRADPNFESSVVVLDSSYLDALRTAGAVLGSLAAVATIFAAVGAYLRGRNLSAPYSTWAVVAVLVPLDMVLGNVTSGPASVVTWVTIAICASAAPASRACTVSDRHTRPWRSRSTSQPMVGRASAMERYVIPFDPRV